MAILEMRVFPDPILRQRARKVNQFDAKLAQLAADMVETMDAHGGVGLAANQIGVLQRLCVIKLQDWEEPLTLVNPEIVRREGTREIEEGCLSIPGYRGMVNRAVRIRVRFQDLTGKPSRLKADCTLAQAIEHETDHLNGILYLDHLTAHDQFFRLRPTDDGNIEYQPVAEPDPAALQDAAQRMNASPQPQPPQFGSSAIPPTASNSEPPADPDAAADATADGDTATAADDAANTDAAAAD